MNNQKEVLRIKKLKKFENECYSKGFINVAGIDEVGRGPLAGPVVAACVVLHRDCYFEGINDSKKVSKKNRERLYQEIINNSFDFGIGIVSEKIIDEINILNATKKAMKIAIENMQNKPDYLLIDYVDLEEIKIPKLSITKGDMKSISIAAASIIAKITRDKLMIEYSRKYKGYGFETNVGYGTKQHITAIKDIGLCEIHRRSFTKKYYR